MMSETKDWNQAIIEEFRANEGKVGGHFQDSTLLLLHTVGAKSGQKRIHPMMYLKDGDQYLVIASKSGAPSNPAWYHNLVANPDVTVEVGSEVFEGKATVTEEPDRSKLFAKMVAANPGFGDYEKMTDRVIPAVLLTRK